MDDRMQPGVLRDLLREGADRAFAQLHVDKESAHMLMSLAMHFGSAKIPHWRESDDSWGGHFSLTVSYSREDRTFSISIEEHKYY